MSRGILPTNADPNTSKVEYDSSGNVIRRRYFDGNGRAIKNIDYQPHHGHPVPHAHDWDWTKQPVRQPARPLRPGE